MYLIFPFGPLCMFLKEIRGKKLFDERRKGIENGGQGGLNLFVQVAMNYALLGQNNSVKRK